MATARPFAYNPGTSIPGTEQVGSLSIGAPTSGFTNNPQYWNGPDEELGYVIAAPVSGNTQPTEIPGVFASLGFYRTSGFSDSDFINLAEIVSIEYGTPQTFLSASDASRWLTDNGFWNSFIPITPTPTETATNTPTPNGTNTPTQTPTQTVTPSVTVGLTPTATGTPAPTPSVTPNYNLTFNNGSTRGVIVSFDDGGGVVPLTEATQSFPINQGQILRAIHGTTFDFPRVNIATTGFVAYIVYINGNETASGGFGTSTTLGLTAGGSPLLSSDNIVLEIVDQP